MERKIKNLELMKSGNFSFYLCEFLPATSSFRLSSTSKKVESGSKFNLLCFFISLGG